MKTRPEAGLVDVFVQRSFNATDACELEGPDGPRAEPCLSLHGIVREKSYLARDGKRILCHFRSPDAESLRLALRGCGVSYDALWAGMVRIVPRAAKWVLVVERVFERPISEEREREFRAKTARCLQDLGVEPAGVLLSRCRKHLLWLCRARTTDAITAAELQLAGHGFEFWRSETGLPTATDTL